MTAPAAVGVPIPARGAPAEVPAPAIRGVGVLTGGEAGADAFQAAPPAGAGLVAAPTPALAGDRFRRATRECLLGVAAARAAVAAAGLPPDALAGPRTGILYVSATGYAPANRAFLEDEGSTTLHFPYTSPSAVPGEVTIDLGVRGPYVNVMGGGPATLQALGWAARWLTEGRADRVLLLAVEVLHEVRDLLGRARRLCPEPWVEGAAALLLEPGGPGSLRWTTTGAGPPGAARVVARVLAGVLDGASPAFRWSGVRGAGRERAEAGVLGARTVGAAMPGTGEALALGPLLALGRAHRAGAPGPWLLTATWRSDYGALLWRRR
jgi:hypothetical protein